MTSKIFFFMALIPLLLAPLVAPTTAFAKLRDTPSTTSSSSTPSPTVSIPKTSISSGGSGSNSGKSSSPETSSTPLTPSSPATTTCPVHV